MEPEMVAAVAACAAALISVLNVGVTARLSRAQESTRWTRELLPELVRELTDALHGYYMRVFYADWHAVPEAERGTYGLEEFKRCSELVGRLQVFADPRTIERAYDAVNRADAIRMYMAARVRSDDDPQRWALYWDYAEASHRFLAAARREMGLGKPPTPPGLARRRAQARRQRVRAILPRVRARLLRRHRDGRT
ncbi:hypothetical protein [Cellulomonas hominis]